MIRAAIASQTRFRLTASRNTAGRSFRRSPAAASPNRLEPAGWNHQARHALERLLSRGAGQGLPTVFDFDNSIVCGDIGEATLAVLARTGILTPSRVVPELCPPFRVPGRGWL